MGRRRGVAPLGLRHRADGLRADLPVPHGRRIAATGHRVLPALIDEFPQSPLCPLAQCRLADCLRLEAIVKHFKVSPEFDVGNAGAAIPAYEKVDAAKGSYAWAWSRMWIGNILCYSAKFNAAAAVFREVAETMPAGPEKSLALWNLAHAASFDKSRLNEVARYCQALRDGPDNRWWICLYDDWGPIQNNRGSSSRSLHELANQRLNSVQKAATKAKSN